LKENLTFQQLEAFLLQNVSKTVLEKFSQFHEVSGIAGHLEAPKSGMEVASELQRLAQRRDRALNQWELPGAL